MRKRTHIGLHITTRIWSALEVTWLPWPSSREFQRCCWWCLFRSFSQPWHLTEGTPSHFCSGLPHRWWVWVHAAGWVIFDWHNKSRVPYFAEMCEVDWTKKTKKWTTKPEMWEQELGACALYLSVTSNHWEMAHYGLYVIDYVSLIWHQHLISLGLELNIFRYCTRIMYVPSKSVMINCPFSKYWHCHGRWIAIWQLLQAQ